MPIKYHFTTRRCALGPSEIEMLEHEVSRLEQRTPQFHPDLLHLAISVEKHPRRKEYEGSVRLTVMNRPLPARHNRGPTLAVLLRQAFEDVEEQLHRFKARLRGDAQVRRLTHTAELWRAKPLTLFEHAEPEVAEGGAGEGLAAASEAGEDAALWAEEPEVGGDLTGAAEGAQEAAVEDPADLLRRALQGDRWAFDRLVHDELAGLREVIGSELARQGQLVSAGTVSAIVVDVLGVGFRQLGRRPEGHSLGQWLSWLAGTAIRRADFGEHLRG